MAVTIGTPAVSSSTQTTVPVSINAPSGTDAILFYFFVEMGTTTRALSDIAGTPSSATKIAEITGGAGPTIRSEMWVLPSPAVGTSTYTFLVNSTIALGEGLFGYSLVSGLNLADIEGGSAVSNTNTGATARNITMTTDTDNALIVSTMVGREQTQSFTWDGTDTPIFGSAFTSTYLGIATQQTTTAGAYGIGGDWSGSPSRSNFLVIAFNESAAVGSANGSAYYLRRRQFAYL